MHASRKLAVAFGLAALAASCFDPVHADAVDALGSETPGVRQGPLHRSGQPCLVCHGGSGPGSPDFVVAGTIYASRSAPAALAGATVEVTDSTGKVVTVATNAAGNFDLSERQLAPVFPLSVRVLSGGKTAKMETLIGRDGGCGSCHRGSGDAQHSAAVFLSEGP